MRRFFEWLVRRAEERRGDAPPSEIDVGDMEWLFPPDDVQTAALWDRYWTAQLEHGLGPPLHDVFCDDRELLVAVDVRGLRTALCVGSGISREPHALAAAGLAVTALDLSPFAMRVASAQTLSEHEAERFFEPTRRRSGGTLDFVTGDLLDMSVCPGPYDVVVERRTLQLFPHQQRRAALEAVATRMSDNGVLLTHCHDGAWRPPAPREHAVAPLLESSGFAIASAASPLPPAGRAAYVLTTTG